MILQPSDLNQRIYGEIQTEITRGDEAIAQRAIAMAIEEAKMYLHRFDLLQLFGDDTSNPPIEATFRSEYLNAIIIDLAVWQLVKLGNPSINYETCKFDYQSALQKLKDIRDQKSQPPDWPYLDTTNLAKPPQGTTVFLKTNEKRRNSF